MTTDMVKVPDLAQVPLATATIILAQAGLGAPEVLFSESYEDKDIVLQQAPARGHIATRGTAVTVWVARRGYVQYLPAIYRRSDAVGKNLVRDLCFLLEHMFGSIEDVIDREASFFDPEACPEEFLPYLAQWTAFALDLEWPLERKRRLVRHAVTLFRLRGTAKGMRLFIKLFCGHEPTIIENEWPFAGFRVESDARIGVDSMILPPIDRARCFIVRMPVAFSELSLDMVVRIHHVIALEKPAHAVYCLRFADDDKRPNVQELMPIGVGMGIGVYDEPTNDGLGGEAKPTRKTKSKPTRSAQ